MIDFNKIRSMTMDELKAAYGVAEVERFTLVCYLSEVEQEILSRLKALMYQGEEVIGYTGNNEPNHYFTQEELTNRKIRMDAIKEAREASKNKIPSHIIGPDWTHHRSSESTWGPRAVETQPREVCRASCCGALGRRTRNGSCAECRGDSQ